MKFVFYLNAQETPNLKKSALNLVSPVPSIGIRINNIICITPTMFFYEEMKPVEDVLLYPICVFSHLMCACKHC